MKFTTPPPVEPTTEILKATRILSTQTSLVRCQQLFGDVNQMLIITTQVASEPVIRR